MNYSKLIVCCIIIILLFLSLSEIEALDNYSKFDHSFQLASDSSVPSAENVYNDIDTISNWYRYLDTAGHRAAEDYIFSKFESFGLNASRQEYTANRKDGSVRAVNVLGLLEGKTEPEKWFVIGGHYDANIRATSAAYDNAAGAASVIELARFFSELYQSNEGPGISILFATWDAEEGGGAGSKYFVDNIEDGIDVVANINLDMFSLNYPITNQIPGSSEEYYKLNLYTGPTSDFSGYSGIDFDDSTLANFTIFQETLKNITYEINDFPPEWVLVMDDTDTASDHKFFIRNSIPAVWFRGMNEYPKNEGDLNERNFKHTPADTLETMERYAGRKTELLKGIETGLTIAYQLTLEVINYTSIDQGALSNSDKIEEGRGISDLGSAGWLIAGTAVLIILGGFYFYKRKDAGS